MTFKDIFPGLPRTTIFYFAVDTIIVNSFILCAAVHPETSMTLMEFRIALFRSLIRGFTSRRRTFMVQHFRGIIGQVQLDVNFQVFLTTSDWTLADTFHRADRNFSSLSFM